MPVSIIIPTRNRAAVLGQCVESLAQQAGQGPGFEIIVVDDGSTDETETILGRLAPKIPVPLRFFRQPTPCGANAARNLGVSEARGEIVVFIDDDALIPEGWFHALTSGFSTCGLPVATGPVRLRTEGRLPGRHQGETATFLTEVHFPASAPNGSLVPIACNMIGFRRDFERTKFDGEVIGPNEETDWLLRADLSVAFLPDAWIWHYKNKEELKRLRLLRLAWRKGAETGLWAREKLSLPFGRRVVDAGKAFATAARAYAHGLLRWCWGGLLIGASQTSRGLVLLGLSRRNGFRGRGV